VIQIDLLPDHLRPIKRTPLPYMVSTLVLALAVLAIAGAYLASAASIAAERGALARSKSELEDPRLQEIVSESNRLETLKASLDRRRTIIEDIISDQIVWSKRLWQLSKLTPENVWYSKIEEDVGKFSEEVLEPDPQTGQMRTVTKTVERPILRVEGYVVPGPDGNSSVTPLTDSLTTTLDLTLPEEMREQDDPEIHADSFGKFFTLDSPTFEDDDFEGYAAKKFKLEFIINSTVSGSAT
jgi:hypothetical protein